MNASTGSRAGLDAGLRADIHVPGRVRAQFDAAAGEVLAVIGPNGAGKTSLLRALAGLVEAEGTAHIGDTDLLAIPVRDRRVGLVFQDQLLFPHLSALENVAFGPRSRGTSRARARETAHEWLERLGVGDLADRLPRQLSGGQAQRVAIARALAVDPDLLLLDEAFTGLDVSVATALRIELARHLRGFAGVTLLVTHDAIDAITLADRVLVVDEGRIAQTGTPAEVAQRPATDHVARLVGLNVVRLGDQVRTFRPTTVTVDLDEPRGSARNRWHGVVASAVPHGDALRLVVRTHAPGSLDLIADVTPASAADLDLAPGRRVWLSVKETSVRTHADTGSSSLRSTPAG